MKYVLYILLAVFASFAFAAWDVWDGASVDSSWNFSGVTGAIERNGGGAVVASGWTDPYTNQALYIHRFASTNATEPWVNDSGTSNNNAYGWIGTTDQATWVPASGVTNAYVTFDGVDDWIKCTNGWTVGDYTMSAWVYWKGPSAAAQVIIGNGDTSTDGATIYLSSSDAWNIHVIHGGRADWDSNIVLPSNEWINVGVYRSTSFNTIQLWTNATFPASSANIALTATPDKQTIGADYDGGFTFNGNIYRAAMYSGTNSLAWITNLYLHTKPWDDNEI